MKRRREIRKDVDFELWITNGARFGGKLTSHLLIAHLELWLLIAIFEAQIGIWNNQATF